MVPNSMRHSRTDHRVVGVVVVRLNQRFGRGKKIRAEKCIVLLVAFLQLS